MFVTHVHLALLISHSHKPFPDKLTHTHAGAEEFGIPDVLSIRLGGNNFLHREAVAAGGMHSCSSVACTICNWSSDVPDRTRS
jgi:hypothetical protein